MLHLSNLGHILLSLETHGVISFFYSIKARQARTVCQIRWVMKLLPTFSRANRKTHFIFLEICLFQRNERTSDSPNLQQMVRYSFDAHVNVTYFTGLFICLLIYIAEHSSL